MQIQFISMKYERKTLRDTITIISLNVIIIQDNYKNKCEINHL